MVRAALAALLACTAAFAQADGGAAVPDGPDVSMMPFGPESIQRVVEFHQPKIQACYEDTLAGKKKVVEGRLMTSWVITSEGLVKRARVERRGTTLKDRRLHDCVIAVLSVMSFPKPPDSRAHPIEYPFNLKAIR